MWALGVVVAGGRRCGRDRAPRRGPISAQVVTTPYNQKILNAKASMNTALKYLTARQYPQATTALSTLRVRLGTAHQSAMTLMGPGRTLTIFNLEHQIAMKLLPFFHAQTRSSVVNALQTTLTTTFADRTALLTKVAALPQDEGVGGDYDDGESDTLPIYTAEVTAYTRALSQYQLSAQGRTAVTKDLATVRATRTQFTQRFGGGE